MNKIVTAAIMGTIIGISISVASELNGKVDIKTRLETRVAYVEQRGDFQDNDEIYDFLLAKILHWAIPANCWDFPETTQIINIYPDDPSMPPEQQRLWLGITLNSDVTPSENIETLVLPAGTYATGRFSITSDQFGAAWEYMYNDWMKQSGYIPTENLAFEIQHNDSSTHPEQKHIIDICIPVKKAKPADQ